MDEASDAEECRVRGSRKLNEETHVNALVLLAWSSNGTHLSHDAISNIAHKLLCSPGQSAKYGCVYLMAKNHPILLNKSVNVNTKRYDPDDLVKKLLSSY